MFIQYEIYDTMIEDFCNLPAAQLFRNVYCPIQAAYDRHITLFSFTH